MSDENRVNYASVRRASNELSKLSEELSSYILMINFVRQSLIDDGNAGKWLEKILEDLQILMAEFHALQAKTQEISEDLQVNTVQFRMQDNSASAAFGGPEHPAPFIPKPESNQVNFRLYSPPKAFPGLRTSLYTYAYMADFLSEVEADVQKFESELGGEIPSPKNAKQTPSIKLGAPITIVPESDELDFEPSSLTKVWHGDWTRFGFEFRPNETLIDETVFVRLSVQIAGVEIAHIKCAIEIEDASTLQTEDEKLDDNPLAQQKFASKTTTAYQRIFISYSRRDTPIARAYKLAQIALGNDVFLDVDNLRAGENWQAALAKAIDAADIFQLFWSDQSSSSKYCQYEWEYALKHKCPDNLCETFIRPVYWTTPLPDVPESLSHLNFKFVPFE